DFGRRANVVKLAPYIGMAGNGRRGLVGPAALAALAGIVLGKVGSGGGQAQALDAGMQPHGLDHGEEVGQAPALLAQQDGARVAEAHGAGGRAVQAQLFLDAFDGDAIGRTVHMVGHEEEAETARAGLVIGASEQAMADAGGHVMVTEGNPYLLAGDEPAAVMQCRPGADAADIGAGFGLGYADGGGPFARNQFRPPFGSGGSIGGG